MVRETMKRGDEMNVNQQLDARDSRRHAAQARAERRRDKREARAAIMIGELASGRFYIWPVGGHYRESGNRNELVQYLIRCRFV